MNAQTSEQKTHSSLLALDDFETLCQRYGQWLVVHNYSELTARHVGYDVKVFREWCAEYGITTPRETTKAILEQYKRYLFHRPMKGRDGKLSVSTVRRVLTSLRMFFCWCTKQGYLLRNPMAEFELPKRDTKVLNNVLTPDQVEQVLSGINIQRDAGLRDRALLETIYSTGIRRSEAANLDVTDVQKARGLILVRKGKGRKDRLVPLGARALAWIEKYRIELRPKWAPVPENNALFLTFRGDRISPRTIGTMVRKYFEAQELDVQGAAHVFRHSMATALLDADMDVRHIQAILGHECINSTQIYTKVALEKLKQVHTQKHPAHLRRG